MAINNMFSTWFNSWFWTGGWNNQDIKAPTKQEKFPWLNAQQIKNIEDYTANLTWIEKTQEQQRLYKAMIQAIEWNNYNDNRVAVENEIFRKCLSKGTQERNYDESCGRQSALVDRVKSVHNLKATTSEEDVLKMLMQEMDYKWVGMDSLNKYLDSWDEEFLYEMWLKSKTTKKAKRIATQVWVWAGVLWAIDAWLYWAGALSEQVWKKIYELPIDSSIQEARQVQRAGVQVKDAEVAVEDAKAELKQAKKTWEWIEEAEKALETAKEDLKSAKWKKVVKVADTAREYNVWWWITEWWSAESRWIQAKSKANQIFKKTINPALENSKSTINVQELISEMWNPKNWEKSLIEKMAKQDPAKQEELFEAWEQLKEEFGWEKFSKMSLKDSQELKSWLQGRTPKKFFRWKNAAEREITDAYKELRAVLWDKLKDSLHSKLSQELWEDTAKLYKDWANLTEYADDMAKQSTNAWLKQGFWNFWSSAYHKLTDWASAKVWLLLNKWWKGVKKATWIEKVADSIWDAWNYVVKNGKKFFKATKWGWLRVEDPVGMVQLLKLAPWTIWEIANNVWETSPAVIADDLLFEVQDFKDTWNNMSDEERIQNIKDQWRQTYGTELNDESANATYEEWKKKHPDGKYWFRDPVNDVELVLYA